jgi:hypothetical protein
MSIPTLEQKKAIIRVLGDLIRHNKPVVPDNDYAYFVYLGIKVLKLNENDMLDAQSEHFALSWYSLIYDLSPTYQFAFKQLMFAILTHNGRTASYLEKTDFEKYLSILPNPDELSLTLDSVKAQIDNYLQINNELFFPWI